MDTLYTCWDNITHYKTKSVNFLGLMDSATKGYGGLAAGLWLRVYGIGRMFRNGGFRV